MKMEAKPDFIRMEHDILTFWDDNRIFDKLREKNKGNKRFRFLDGPITANNPMGIHHAWGRSIKDITLRYKAMNGYSCHYRNGFDTQGLWVEVEVEKELGFTDKKDIEAYGLDKFTEKCVDRIEHFSETITKQSKRLGQWMDWDNSYYTHTDENITAIWHFLKICHKNGWITKSFRPMPWCPRCGTSLSEHEMSGSYRELTHTAVFAVARMEQSDFDMLVWTTTPWTLTANTALAVNPELEYAVVRFDGFDKPLVLAKNAVNRFECQKKVLYLLRGSELIGRQYETFFPSLAVQNAINHTIIPWDAVSADEGSGVVHIAPGCGVEDYELGKSFSLSEICPIDEAGNILNNYDIFSGKPATEIAPLIFKVLQDNGKLFKTHEYTHSYPVCWRCKTGVLFRLVQEWYIKTDEIKPKLIRAAEGVRWEPAFIGKRMTDWLVNMGDWNISRKRYYGLPLPFYPCESCGCLTVVGSKGELMKLTGNAAVNLPELHRPWIDDVKILCPHCGKTVSRVPEVGDVWLDAGIVPYSTLGYFSDIEEWNKNFPAEWIIEMQEQVRLWFYSQLFMSVTITGKAPYERVQTNNWVLAEDGTKFSKTGFMIRFDEAAERIGVDAIRYLFAGASTASDVRFGYSLGDEARRKLLGFWNIYCFFMTYAEIDKPVITDQKSNNIMDEWLLNRIRLFIDNSVKCYDDYTTQELVHEFELCIDDVSNWYVRANRRRFWKDDFDSDKQNAYNALFFAIKSIAQIMAPVLPFMTEQIWQSMILAYSKAEESVHLSQFPIPVTCDRTLLDEAGAARSVIAKALKLRNEKNLKIKQPLQSLFLGENYRQSCSNFEEIIKEEINVKELIYLADFNSLIEERLSLNYQVAGKILKDKLNTVKSLCDDLTPFEHEQLIKEYRNGSGIKIKGFDDLLSADCFLLQSKEKENTALSADGTPIAISTLISTSLKSEGMYRELLRHCQLLRKEAGFFVSDRVSLYFSTESVSISAIIQEHAKDIERETLSVINEMEVPRMSKEFKINDDTVIISIA